MLVKPNPTQPKLSHEKSSLLAYLHVGQHDFMGSAHLSPGNMWFEWNIFFFFFLLVIIFNLFI